MRSTRGVRGGNEEMVRNASGREREISTLLTSAPRFVLELHDLKASCTRTNLSHKKVWERTARGGQNSCRFVLERIRKREEASSRRLCPLDSRAGIETLLSSVRNGPTN